MTKSEIDAIPIKPLIQCSSVCYAGEAVCNTAFDVYKSDECGIYVLVCDGERGTREIIAKNISSMQLAIAICRQEYELRARAILSSIILTQENGNA